MKRGRFAKPGMLAMASAQWGLEFEVEIVEPKAFEEVNGVAVVSVCGPLTHHPEWFWDSYDAVRERVAAAFASSCRAVVLELDSPGGDVSGCYETSRELRAMAKASGKPLVAFVDGLAASGAYSLACAAESIVVPPSGFVGSIGVIQALVDQTAADRAMGLRFAVVASGARKADGHPHAPLTDGAIAEAQSQVDSLAEDFFAWVSEARAITVESVRSLEAGVFHGTRAVTVGLADAVMTKSELLSMVASGKTENRQRADAEAKAMDYKELIAALKQMAEGDGDDADKAKEALKALDGGGDDDKKDDKDPPAKEEKSNEDKEPPPADDDGDKKSSAAATKREAKLLSQIGERDRRIAELERKNEKVAVEDLIAAHPELTESQRTHLRTQSVERVKELLLFMAPTSAAATVGAATRGEGQGSDEVHRAPRLAAADRAELDERMGLGAKKSAVKRNGNVVQFGVMTRDTAEAALAQKKGAGQ